MAGPSAELNNFRQKPQMIPSMSQLSLNSSRFQIERSARLNSYQTPLERRTGFFAERNDQNVESFEHIFWKMAERSLLDEIEPRLPNKDELRLVHSEKLISSKFSVSPLAMENRESSQFHSLSGIVDTTVAVGVNQLRNGFAFVNNSGTQAEKDFSHDFPFNSIAIAIRSLLEQRPNFRLFVFDLGEKHATGTQSIFYSDPNVLTVSFHRNQGSLERTEEIGRGTGLGYNLNVPLPENLSDDDMKVVADVVLLPLMVEFEPEVVIVNTNFSSYFDKTSPELYGWLMGEISQIAAQKVVVVFNGLENSVLPARIALNMLLAVQQKEAFQKLKRKPFLREPVRQTITSIIHAQSKYWPCLQRSRLFLEQLIDSTQENDSDDENIKVD